MILRIILIDDLYVRSDSLHQVEEKISRIFGTFQEFEKSHQQELIKLKSELLSSLNSVTVNETENSAYLLEAERRIVDQITEK